MTLHIDTDQWSEIIDALSRNKLRSFLTAFGIFWGVFMLVLLMGGGKGLESMLGQIFTGFASNSGFAGAMPTSKPYHGFRKGRIWNIQLQDVERVRNSVPELNIVTGTNNLWSVAYHADKSLNISLRGIFPDFQDISDPRLTAGRRINDIDVAQRRKVCVVGSRVAEALFPGEKDVCGQRIRIDGIHYTIIGLSGRSGNGININGNALTMVDVPFTTLQQAYGLGTKVDMLAFTAKPGFHISSIQKKVGDILRHTHDISPEDTQAVLPLNTEAIFNLMDSLMRGISILVWMIGIGTILSGAIGVSNIMMVTVRERTTEIGIRRAIGATPYDIMRQILSESMVLTLLAGLGGITCSVLILATLNRFVQNSNMGSSSTTFLITFWTALGAAALIALLGLIAGITPAIRAMRIRPVEAMRSDE